MLRELGSPSASGGHGLLHSASASNAAFSHLRRDSRGGGGGGGGSGACDDASGGGSTVIEMAPAHGSGAGGSSNSSADVRLSSSAGVLADAAAPSYSTPPSAVGCSTTVAPDAARLRAPRSPLTVGLHAGGGSHAAAAHAFQVAAAQAVDLPVAAAVPPGGNGGGPGGGAALRHAVHSRAGEAVALRNYDSQFGGGVVGGGAASFTDGLPPGTDATAST